MGLYDILKSLREKDGINDEVDLSETKEDVVEPDEPDEGDVIVAEKPDNDRQDDLSDDEQEEVVKDPVKPALTETDFYRHRQELKAEREARERLEKELAEIKAKISPGEPVPDKDIDPDAYSEWVQAQQAKKQDDLEKEFQRMQVEIARERAFNELKQHENKFIEMQPDYVAVIDNAYRREISSKKKLNPNLTEGQIRAVLDQEKLELALHFVREGVDPVKGIYEFLTEKYGRPEPEAKKTSNLASVQKNRQKSASPLAAGGKSSATGLTEADVHTLTPAKFAKLTAAQKAQLFGGAR